VIRIAVAALLLASSCELGPFPKDPTTAPSSWPEPIPDDPVFAAGGGSSCPNAIENTKRLGCGFEADDPAKWCATLTAKQVKCLTDSKNCLANSQCTEVSQ